MFLNSFFMKYSKIAKNYVFLPNVNKLRFNKQIKGQKLKAKQKIDKNMFHVSSDKNKYPSESTKSNY